MSTIQAGTRLFRQFGTGDRLRKVWTEVLENGKTYTRVFDSKGQLVTQRVKSITKIPVGNKNVITKATARTGANGAIGYKYTDRVYNQSNELLGIRVTGLEGGYKGVNKYAVQKANVSTTNPVTGVTDTYTRYVPTKSHTVTNFATSGVTNKPLRTGRTYPSYTNSTPLSFNEHGLPIPPLLNASNYNPAKELVTYRNNLLEQAAKNRGYKLSVAEHYNHLLKQLTPEIEKFNPYSMKYMQQRTNGIKQHVQKNVNYNQITNKIYENAFSTNLFYPEHNIPIKSNGFQALTQSERNFINLI